MGDVFDEDLMRELGLDPAEMENVKKNLSPQASAAPTAKPPPRPAVKSATPPPAHAPVASTPPPAPTAATPAPAQRQPPKIEKPAPPVPPPTPGEGLVQGVSVQIAAVVAKKAIPLREVISLRAGEVIDFRRSPDEPIDLVANGKLVAKAELVTVDGRIGARVIKLIR